MLRNVFSNSQIVATYKFLINLKQRSLGKTFLWQSESQHILGFATVSNIRLLTTSRTWGMDDTFKIVPQWYQQRFTIQSFLEGKLVPVVDCLCKALINKAAVRRVSRDPLMIICDFETALIPVIQGYFLNTRGTWHLFPVMPSGTKQSQ
ncbi:hypothetical protein T11_35 [Trichinella zimbabwensis]|uniref:Uncharacterized protein n=1 Tax=Trichinella zimbabwensis TaxID=268475 RepID=A0A0V1HKD6_9BILA|nr:hypothetical protein T11_35 [Trichinella zimbabwensis]